MHGDDHAEHYQDNPDWPQTSFLRISRDHPDHYKVTIDASKLQQLLSQDCVIIVLYYEADRFPTAYYMEMAEAVEFFQFITTSQNETTPDIPNVDDEHDL